MAQLIREGKRFAVLIAVDLLPQIKVTKAKGNDETVEQALLNMPTILIAPLALVWLVNHPIISSQNRVMWSFTEPMIEFQRKR